MEVASVSGYVRQIPVARRGTSPSPATTASKIHARLKQDIIAGVLRPADKLNIDALRVSYGVGASPIREALATLAAQGFVHLEDQRGYWVAPISGETLQDILSTRSVVESRALSDSIRNGDDVWEAGVIAAHHRLSRASARASFDVALWEERHREFHLSLLAACGSEWLFRFCSLLHDQFDRYRRVCRIDPIDEDPVTPSHSAIMEAAIDRRVDEAIALLEEHKMCSGRRVLSVLDVEPDAPTRKPVR